MKLTDRFDEDVIEYKGREIRLNLSFDVVLRSFELVKDPHFTDAEKIELLIHMFVANPETVVDLGPQEKGLIVKAIFDHFINDGDEPNGEKPLYDLEKDAEYIFASFMYDYGIDLIEAQGKLHWKKFKALLVGLSDDSMFKRVIAIRAAEIPPPNRYNQKERRQLIELKRAFSLDQVETVEDIDRRFDELAVIMENWAKGGNKHGNPNRREKSGNPC